MPCMGEPGGLQSIGLQRVGYDWVTSMHTDGVHAIEKFIKWPGKMQNTFSLIYLLK